MPWDRRRAGEAVSWIEAGELQDLGAGGWQRQDRRRADRARRIGVRAGEPQALGDGQALEHARDLELAADAERDDPVGGQPVIGLPRDLDRALEGLSAVAQTADERRLACSVRADDADELARRGSRG